MTQLRSAAVMFLFLPELILWKFEQRVRFPKWFYEMSYICTVYLQPTISDWRLQILCCDDAALGAWAGWPWLVSHDANTITLLL